MPHSLPDAGSINVTETLTQAIALHGQDRLADAERDGDHIYAVLAGFGLSNDIGGNLLAPASEGQLRAMREAYRQAGWSPQDVDMIECHATGTSLGDATEFASLQTLWGAHGWKPVGTSPQR